jgi:small subunit ribosomal protein S4
MARYTGPRSKVSRRFGVPIFGPSKALDRRNFPPGVHGAKGKRKMSEYAVALGEKQKLRYQYGVLERQFRRYFEIARHKRGVTGEILLQLLESRLDNIVFRLGLATSRRVARQMVAHGHVMVGDRRCSIPSRQLKVGEVVTVRNNPKARQMAVRHLEASSTGVVPDWLVLDKDNFSGKLIRVPTRDEIQPIVNEQLIVELYSR